MRRLVLSRRSRGILADRQGATIVEFALILPVLCTLMLSALDFSHSLYMQAVLQGTLQKAARDGTLETGTEASMQQAIDTRVENQLLPLNRAADVRFNRRYYRTFSKAAAAQAEQFMDSPVGSLYHDGICNNDEAYTDANNNEEWDKDGGNSGQGGARDVVLYTVTVTYPRLFPIDKFVGGSGTTNLKASTVLTNQPYGDQAKYGEPTLRYCTSP